MSDFAPHYVTDAEMRAMGIPVKNIKPARSVLIPTESEEQKTVARWWSVACFDYNLPEQVLMACPAQAARSPRGGARMKAEGYRAGTPDFFLSVQRKGFPGLFIEMKRRDGGTLSDNQKEMSFLLIEQGYRCNVAHGATAAIAIIAEYLSP